MKRAAILLLGACTTLGPMPATTGISAQPVGRPGMEGQVGTMPGFYASQAARNDPAGKTMNHASVLVDLDRWLPVKGVLVGGRVFGSDGDTPVEPYLGYRRRLIEGVALGGIVFGSSKRGGSMTASPGATYHGVRFGGEAMVDVEVYAPNPWFRIRAQGAASLTRILLSGTYCIFTGGGNPDPDDPDVGAGIDCNENSSSNTVISGKVVGLYPAGTATLALDMGRHEGIFHSVRLALLGSAGRMPLVLSGEDNGSGTYYSLGVSLTVSLGLGRAAARQ